MSRVPQIRVIALGGTIASTRDPVGRANVLRKTYGGFAGAETELFAAGLIPATDLDGLKAGIALSLILAQKMTINQITGAFRELGTLTGKIP